MHEPRAGIVHEIGEIGWTVGNAAAITETNSDAEILELDRPTAHVG